jgi:hypothetical protein
MKRLSQKGLARVAAVVSLMGLGACVDPITIETNDVTPKLVVHGLITDQNDPQLNKVTLTWTEPFDGEKGIVYSRPVDQAQVSIYDSQDNEMPLFGGNRGVYYVPEEFHSVAPGRSYRIHIRLPDGREYESRPEMLREAPPIEELSYEYKRFTEVVTNGSGDLVEKTSVGFQVDATVKDPAESIDHYRWDAEGIFEYFSIAPEIRNPPPSQCWSYVGRIVTKAVTTSDRLFNGNRHKQPVVVVAGDMPTKYQVKVRQYSLSAQAYEFWRLFNQQQASVGSIFDPPPAQIRGNLYSITHPEEQVIGYFGASGVAEKKLLINRLVHGPFPGLPYEVPYGGCLGLYPNSTDIKPPGF